MFLSTKGRWLPKEIRMKFVVTLLTHFPTKTKTLTSQMYTNGM